MKPIRFLSWLLALCTAGCIFFSAAVNAEENVQDFAQISGKGVCYVPADTATINICIENRGGREEKVLRENKAILEKIRLASLMEDAPFFLSEESCGSFCDGNDFCVSRYLTITPARIDTISTVCERIEACGVLSVNCVFYSVRDTSPYAARLLDLAIEDAKSKLPALNGNFEILSVQEFGVYSFWDNTQPASDIPQVTLNCDVSVTFRPVR